MYDHIVFDLDGTLIDSAAAILASYRAAFTVCGVAPARAIETDIIGPPIVETLRLLTGNAAPALIGELSDAFKRSYDTGGLLETLTYPGIGEMLAELRAAGRNLYIATNKRIHPTRLILEHFGWSACFDTVYALDLFSPCLPDKAAMIGRLLTDYALGTEQAVYVGDRFEDGEAAEANGLPFIAATWGYGSPRATAMAKRWREAATPRELGQMLLAGRR
ncbi:MAG: HAD hydrolase-like protein [Azoarcus sp.]|jgi:phosphoglycolate phosphatase|nr:HAD hydrolase-like protein [Azoarcus sp.]